MNNSPMQFVSPPGRSLLLEVWRHKTSMLGGVMAIVSLSLAHYAGFLMEVPLQIVAVAGMSLAKGVTATFLFYVFFCAVVARVVTSILQLVILPFIVVNDRLERGLRVKMDLSRQRLFVRSHSQTIKWEGIIWIVFQAMAFLLIVLGIYVEFKITWISAAGLLVAIVLIILSGLVRSGFFLQPNPRIFIKKIKTRRARSGRVASAAFVTTTAALIIVAFFIGDMRASLLRDQKAHTIVTKEFTGMATVIASSGGQVLLYQRQGSESRYIYSTPEFTTSVESKRVFTPIGAK
ncbi:hypothetical protein [Janthinobacterium sp. GMG1]|uniref:hypothetical protein n=1 Tax=Janthinobacterium sp. GMG1 TaxID=3096007 RepID=UPI002ACAFDFB|nr:hypothetical protein [Janthinobacterium sp. GMG1]MDZ5631891.1 hypothetical protein [Janthinobacterium sp. GMG1]